MKLSFLLFLFIAAAAQSYAVRQDSTDLSYVPISLISTYGPQGLMLGVSGGFFTFTRTAPLNLTLEMSFSTLWNMDTNYRLTLGLEGGVGINFGRDHFSGERGLSFIMTGGGFYERSFGMLGRPDYVATGFYLAPSLVWLPARWLGFRIRPQLNFAVNEPGLRFHYTGLALSLLL